MGDFFVGFLSIFYGSFRDRPTGRLSRNLHEITSFAGAAHVLCPLSFAVLSRHVSFGVPESWEIEMQITQDIDRFEVFDQSQDRLIAFGNWTISMCGLFPQKKNKNLWKENQGSCSFWTGTAADRRTRLQLAMKFCHLARSDGERRFVLWRWTVKNQFAKIGGKYERFIDCFVIRIWIMTGSWQMETKQG